MLRLAPVNDKYHNAPLAVGFIGDIYLSFWEPLRRLRTCHCPSGWAPLQPPQSLSSSPVLSLSWWPRPLFTLNPTWRGWGGPWCPDLRTESKSLPAWDHFRYRPPAIYLPNVRANPLQDEWRKKPACVKITNRSNTCGLPGRLPLLLLLHRPPSANWRNFPPSWFFITSERRTGAPSSGLHVDSRKDNQDNFSELKLYKFQKTTPYERPPSEKTDAFVLPTFSWRT